MRNELGRVEERVYGVLHPSILESRVKIRIRVLFDRDGASGRSMHGIIDRVRVGDFELDAGQLVERILEVRVHDVEPARVVGAEESVVRLRCDIIALSLLTVPTVRRAPGGKIL